MITVGVDEPVNWRESPHTQFTHAVCVASRYFNTVPYKSTLSHTQHGDAQQGLQRPAGLEHLWRKVEAQVYEDSVATGASLPRLRK